MSKFDAGVTGYVVGQAIVTVFFPKDKSGKADISCRQCQFFQHTSKRCGLNGNVVNYPEKYVGTECPLDRVEEDA